MGLKDAAFEQSSPIHHMAELCEILKKSDVPFAPIVFLYTNHFHIRPPAYLHFSADLSDLFVSQAGPRLSVCSPYCTLKLSPFVGMMCHSVCLKCGTVPSVAL